MMRCSRPMSCAVGRTPWSGGRRSTNSWPAASVMCAVMFDWPPVISAALNGARNCGSASSAQPAKDARSIPVGAPSGTRLPARELGGATFGECGDAFAEVVSGAQALLLAVLARRRALHALGEVAAHGLADR